MPNWLRLASIEITQRCNRQCAYCEQHKANRDMPVAQFAGLLDSLAAEGFQAIALGGGEPTLHPELALLLGQAQEYGLRAGLTTNSRAPALVLDLVQKGLLESFGVSAGKEEWTSLVSHACATVNLLLVHQGLAEVAAWAVEAVRRGAHRLLLLGYKGQRSEFVPSTAEVSMAFSLLTQIGRRTGIVVAADDYTRRRLRLAQSCGDGFLRISVDGVRDVCCFPNCEFRTAPQQSSSSSQPA